MKQKVMFLAIDDGPHRREDLLHYRLQQNNLKSTFIPLVAVACKGLQLVHVSRTHVEVDGLDSTEKIIDLFHNNPFRLEIRLIMIDSPTVAGFNIVDPEKIFRETETPVLLLPDSPPNGAIHDVYSHVFPNRTAQIDVLKRLPHLESMEISIKTDPHIHGTIYFHIIGATKEEIRPVLIYLAEYSLIPEPLRLAHVIASIPIER
jgi:endonuclease V-like protein UPF0215 family